jgi:hypothetical protein
MKRSLSILICTVCAAAAMQAVAATRSQGTTSQTPAPIPTQQPGDVNTSGRNWTASDGVDLIPPMMLDRQGVQSWGAATQTGPRNEHLTPPHGGPVVTGTRLNSPGRE